MKNKLYRNIPKGWDSAAHIQWLNGQRVQAIQLTVKKFNSHGAKKPIELIMQLVYYFFLCNDFQAAAQILEASYKHHPKSQEILLNLGVCLSRLQEHKKTVFYLEKLLLLNPNSSAAYDALTSSYYRLGLFSKAKDAGTKSLAIKDKSVNQQSWKMPQSSPQQYLKNSEKRNTIAFSLWGAHPRYLRGAIDNVLAAKDIYPNWDIRIYYDDTVPKNIQELLAALGADMHHEKTQQNMFQKLTWRFKVASDASVRRFLIRDIDSLINQREAQAVEEWIASDKYFHIMRDWWTHTDLILAGMWGGIATTLPSMEKLLNSYNPTKMPTQNIDQWFLKDAIWPIIRKQSLIHDRYFQSINSQTWPTETPQNNIHVGQDIFAAHNKEQEKRLHFWITRFPELQIKKA